MEIILCPQCGAPQKVGSDYCEECGIRLTPYKNTKTKPEEKSDENYELNPLDSLLISNKIKKEFKEKDLGSINKVQELSAKQVYSRISKYLHVKDGYLHVLMINSFSRWLNQNFDCENKYTIQIDFIITSMQENGYEIEDIKFNSLMNQGLFGEMEGFHTLIMYK